jgi:methyl-accepting chemotaxis protein
VVAKEVGTLADGSTKATKDITEILNKLQNQSLQVLGQIESGVATVHEGTLVAAEAKLAFEKIVNTSKDTDNQVKEITSEIQKMVDEIKRVEDMSENIAAIAEESSVSSEEVAAAAQEQTATLQEILDSASMLATMAEDLQKMVRQFTL